MEVAKSNIRRIANRFIVAKIDRYTRMTMSVFDDEAVVDIDGRNYGGVQTKATFVFDDPAEVEKIIEFLKKVKKAMVKCAR